ncbi:hypothetical protein ABZ370_31660 [Streptomyces sp. NPDC005962]|uniref:hypothetical protein n=1 Tax=Streptomyces sp. NPDC005962 TaxID=3154466 RepID=UPI0033FF7FD2
MSTTPPPRCFNCRTNYVAWTKPRVDYCYVCLPGGPFTPPACRRCGSTGYFSQGLCAVCHPGGPGYPGSCRGCLAWGVQRAYSWHCWACRWWQGHYPVGTCMYCEREAPIGDAGACRLCLEEGRRNKNADRAINYAAVARTGQQLYLANLHSAYAEGAARKVNRPKHPTQVVRPPINPRFAPVRWRQLILFRMPPDQAALKRRTTAPDTGMLAYCDAILREHAARHGWSKKLTNDVKRSIKLLHALQATPGAKIHATDVLELPRLGGTAVSTLEILTAADLLIDDRTLAVRHYFAKHTAGLPPAMTQQLQTWLDVMLDGSQKAPRRHARHPQTAHLHILGMATILRAWAEEGHESLAEITREDYTNALPERGAHRNFAEQGFRSLFTILKGRKQVFTNPTRGIPLTRVAGTIPLPLDTEAIRSALNSPDPACALAVALVAFHALTSPQLASLQVTDIQDGRLRLADRNFPLAGPVLTRLTAYLDHRARTWPTSLNSHLFINRKTAPRLVPVSRNFPWTQAQLKPQALREDRILQEIHATGGDVRRICDLFGLSIEAAQRYANTVEHPGLTESRVPGSRNPRVR